MASEAEPDRIALKTSPLVLRHHLDWAGLQSGESFVDFGSATGDATREAARVSGSGAVVGIDGDVAMLERSVALAQAAGLGNTSYVRAWIAGPGSTPLAEGSFDHAWTRFLLEYLPEPAEAIREMSRIVRPGGRVTLIDIDGNCIWHYPLPPALRAQLDEVVDDLGTLGFDPHIGRRLARYAAQVGLVDVRESIEPYHSIVGSPDASTAEAWRRKITGVKQAYCDRLFPAKRARAAGFFDALLDFILADDTMTWSNLHLVQGIRR